ncbi:MAG: hypothetical protein IT372_27350 [Polyangiaceae bacterium]|nr:hypothetical protein [Polyangiaceae bacterium]
MSGRAGGGAAEGEVNVIQERIARAGHSIVGLRAGALSATGWIALASGVVVTSRRAIGYPTEVSIKVGDGAPIGGRVIAADVGRDVALVLPVEAPGAAALAPRHAPEPRLGEPAIALSAVAGRGLRLSACRISHVRRGDAALGFEIDAPAPLGAPVLDVEGRVLGVVVDPPRGDPEPRPAGRAVALAAGALQPLLAVIDRPAAELRDRAPVYRCPACEEPFEIESDRCGACGRALPHAFPPSAARAAAERLIRDGLSALGLVANRVRVGPRSWRVAQRAFSTDEATHVEVEIDEAGRHLAIRAPVVGLPAANHEPFYRFLLTMNDQTTGELRVSVAGDLVSVSRVDPIEGRAASDVAMLIDEIVRTSEEYRRTLADTFEAVPRFDLPRT